jgi:hypothetical protein
MGSPTGRPGEFLGEGALGEQPYGTFPPVNTFKAMRTEVAAWLRETVSDDIIAAAVNDAMEQFWSALVIYFVQAFLGGPVTDITIAAGASRVGLNPLPNDDELAYIKEVTVRSDNGTLRTWQAAELGGEWMKRAQREVASTSSSSPYVYDVLTNSTMEVRPAAGTTLTPSFFYVRKVKRMIVGASPAGDDDSPLPFGSYVASWPYIKYKSMSLIQAVLKEWAASQYWDGMAERQKGEAQQVANQQNVQRQRTIVPFMR